MRTHGLNRWNWSEKARKWVYVELKNGERIYKYRDTPPKEFMELTKKLQVLNQKLLVEIDQNKNAEIYKELMIVSQKMQAMRS